LKKWACREVKQSKHVAETIEEMQEMGWRLQTYQTGGLAVYHYLLFEKGD
jgi:lipoate-protein ligase A